MSRTTENQDPQPFCVMVHGYARPDKTDAAKSALEKIADPTRSNAGCLEFRIFQDTDDPRSFTLLERWTSLPAVLAHGQSDYMAEYNATKDEIFEKLDGDFLSELRPVSAAP